MAKKKSQIDEEYVFDPVKEAKDGKQAQAVIWSTKSLDMAVEAINQGLELKANPFLGKNTRLLKPDLVYKRTKEELDEYIKCMEDPVYFAKYCTLMTPEGLQRVTLRDYQIEYLRHLQHNRFSIFLSCRQSGKSTTTMIYALWMAIFHTDKNILILSKSAAAGIDLVSKAKECFAALPYFLKPGVNRWNQSSISFDSSSKISTEAFSDTAGLGQTINVLILDEFAWCPPNMVELFYNNIIPTVTTISDSNVCIMSTQNGFNLFYKIWQGAITKKNIYAPFKVDWNQVPQFNSKTKKWEKRTQKWKETMVGILGSEEAFQYQYGTSFSASDACILSRESMAAFRENAVLYESISDDMQYSNLNKKDFYIKANYPISNFKERHYVILVDLAEGGGGDYTIFNIIEITDKDKFKQVAFWRCNTVDIEHAALEFWVMFAQLFDSEKTLISIEWNTYGALFYNYILHLNESDYMIEHSWRFNYGDEIDMNSIVYYKKGANEEDVAGLNMTSKGKMVPGIRFNSSNKITACSLLKMMLERRDIEIEDLVTISELENFEDKNGNGSYKASYGHDDLIMTFCQIPMLMQTSKYKFFIEEMEQDVAVNNYIESYIPKLDKFESIDFYGAIGTTVR